MKTSLILWGPDRGLTERIAQRVAAVVDCPCGDVDSALASPTPRVGVASPDLLLDRRRRLQTLDAGTLVSILPDCAADSSDLSELESRCYRECHLQIRVEASGEEASSAARAIACWERASVAVGAFDATYTVDVAGDWPAFRERSCFHKASAVLFISDENVFPLHGERVEALIRGGGCRVETHVMAAGERHKNLSTVEGIWRRAQAAGIDRSGLVVALGGGVVTDMAGFAAASWMRGVPWVALPTTLLAMVDASVGGKTGVDLGKGKNAVGSFWQPSMVVCATKVLETEPRRGFIGALAEVVKTAMIGDPELFLLLEKHASELLARDETLVREVVRRCIRVKSRVVGLDAREGGLRATLNLGHTLGHALEADGDYSLLSHGEAVSLGLVAALRIGESLGATPSDLASRTVALLGRLRLPTSLDPAALRRSVELLAYDKKRAGSELSFIFAHGLGDVRRRRMGLDELRGQTLKLAESLGG